MINTVMKEPLVSVIVLTYNSSKTIVETLDSILSQSYSRIELVVSDDCSTDNTVEVVQEWIKIHKQRFELVKVVLAEKNNGVSANWNRAEKDCSGEWIKIIAGDDILLDDCLETYMGYVKVNPDAKFLFSLIRPFGGTEDYRKAVEEYSLSQIEFFTWTINQQYNYLTQQSNCLCAPTFFYNKEKSVELGVTCDERIPMIDDWPKWINLLKKGVRIHFINKETVLYRISETSLSNQEKPSEKIRKSRDMIFLYYQFWPCYRAGRRRYALREYFRIKKDWSAGFFWNIIYRLSKQVL